jgi:hypothetical protein
VVPSAKRSRRAVSMKNTRVSRRDVVKLAGAVASLGAGLGVVLESADAHAAEVGVLQFKFFRLGEGADENRAEMLVTIKLTPEEESRILSVPQGRLQLKISMLEGKFSTASSAEPSPTILVKQIIPLDPNRVQGKFKSPPVKLPK